MIRFSRVSSRIAEVKRLFESAQARRLVSLRILTGSSFSEGDASEIGEVEDVFALLQADMK
jgi:hypothetical protein